MLEFLVAICIVLSLILYALMGGADFGGGIWDLLARGVRARLQREAIAEALAPIWEANHVWLILAIVLLFTGFPRGFAAIMTALNIPLTVMLIGIVLRGSAFAFRKYGSETGMAQRRWSLTFGAASILTPVCQGLTIGALASGAIRVEDGRVLSGWFAGWLTPFAGACAVFTLVLYAFLAATYLTLDTADNPGLQNDFRLRAIWSELALAPVALAVFFTSHRDAPAIFAGGTSWWGPWLLACTSCFAVGALLALWRRRFAVARIAAIGQVTLILAGWGLVQYPHLVIPDVTIANSAAPAITLRLLLWTLGGGALVLLPSLVFLFYLFKGKRRVRENVAGPVR